MTDPTVQEGKVPIPTSRSSRSDDFPNHEEPAVKEDMPAFQSAVVVESDQIGGATQRRGLRFWSIVLALVSCALLATLEGTIISTALPTIIRNLGGGSIYTWAINAYFLTSMAFQPLYGQTANIFGRKSLMVTAIFTFIVGSAIAGASQSMAMLIAGRAIQGIGGGGINMLTNLVICDIVPLRERGSFMAILYIVVLVATAMGPFVGGAIVQHTTWRWVFFLNLPIGGMSLILVVLFMNVKYTKEATFTAKVLRINFIGNFIFVGSVVSILLALTWGGTRYNWSSSKVIVPLLIGFLGMAVFHIYESSKYCVEPTMPPYLFKNRTSAAAFLITFLHSALLYWLIYYIPVYFQAVLGSTPARSGVQLLPTAMIMVPFAAIGGKLMAKFGRYRPFHHLGFGFATIGFGCMTLLRSTSSTGTWVGFQAIVAVGLGLIAPSALPAVLAPMEEKDVATATGTWSYLKSFGVICGVTIASVVFNSEFTHLSSRIDDPDIRAQLSGGQAYEHATKSLVNTFQGVARDQIIGVYTDSLKAVWQVGTAIAGFAFLVVFVEKELKLRTTLSTEYGIKEKEEAKGEP